MIYDISKFMKNEMFGSNITKKAGTEPGLYCFNIVVLLILFYEIQTGTCFKPVDLGFIVGVFCQNIF